MSFQCLENKDKKESSFTKNNYKIEICRDNVLQEEESILIKSAIRKWKI